MEKGSGVRKDTLTIYDIAKMADVSVSTVSRVLNGKFVVNEQNRQKVLNIMATYHFQPNRLALSLLKNAFQNRRGFDEITTFSALALYGQPGFLQPRSAHAAGTSFAGSIGQMRETISTRVG
jgi:Bacterial regulatory proteins, lacI family